MLTAKLVRLETTWSAMPQPRRRTALLFSRCRAAIHDRRSPDAGVSDSAAINHKISDGMVVIRTKPSIASHSGRIQPRRRASGTKARQHTATQPYTRRYGQLVVSSSPTGGSYGGGIPSVE